MRLPESVTCISPVGEVIEASGAGEALLSAAAETANDRMFVSSADVRGLSCWERDYGLADGIGESAERRRARLRGARAGGVTLTPEKLRTLALNVSGVEDAEVREDFGAYRVTLKLSGTDQQLLGEAVRALRETVARQKPAHLLVSVQTGIEELWSERCEARHGGVLRVLWADAPV